MASITVPIQVNLPDNWIEQVVERLKQEGDYVPIVRCKDCKYLTGWEDLSGYVHYCPVIDKVTSVDFFCADGERGTE